MSLSHLAGGRYGPEPHHRSSRAALWEIFVRTDLFAHGLLSFGQMIELDYVFEPFFSNLPPKFG